MKGLRKFLGVFDFVLIVACAFRVFAIYNDYTRHPELYATYGTPWYSSIIITAVFTAAIVLITTIAYFVVGHIISKRVLRQNPNDPAE